MRVGCILGGGPGVVVQLLELKATEGLEVNTRVVRGVVDRHGWWGVAKAGQGYIAFQADVTRNRMPEIEK